MRGDYTLFAPARLRNMLFIPARGAHAEGGASPTTQPTCTPVHSPALCRACRDLTEYREAMVQINTGGAVSSAPCVAALVDTTRALASTINALPELQEKKRLIDGAHVALSIPTRTFGRAAPATLYLAHTLFAPVCSTHEYCHGAPVPYKGAIYRFVLRA